MEGFFIWNGVDSREMGVVVTRYPPIVYPAERVEQVTVPGRSGHLTRLQGPHVYDGYLLSVGIGNRKAADPRAVAAWLRGEGTLILGSEPDRVYFGRLVKEASLDRAMRGVYSGTVAWMVQPGKGQYPPEPDITVDGRHVEIYNPGDLPAQPIYRITKGTGTNIQLFLGPISRYSHVTVTLAGTSWEGAEEVTIDSDAMQVTTQGESGPESLNSVTKIYYNGAEGLWVPPHETVEIDVVGDTQSAVTVTPRWRWL